MSTNVKERNLFQTNQKVYRVDLTLFYLSLSVLAGKVFIGHWPEVISWCCSNNDYLAWSTLLLPLQWISSAIFTKAVLIGIILSTFSWQITYINSNVPGVDPPTPFSPLKYRRRSGHNWHLNYISAALIGPIVTILLTLGVI